MAAAQALTLVAKWKANGSPGGHHLHYLCKQWRSIVPVTKSIRAWRPSLSNQGGKMAGTHLPRHMYEILLKFENQGLSD